ncbi:unnamed protein product [Paramecium sonneborni]|nr:unnamed protein product [Paramecium sonneborni]
MILRYHTIEIYDQHGQKIETKKSFPFVNQPVSKDIKYNQIIGQKDEQLLKQSGNFVTSNIVDSYANYLYFSLKADDRKMYKRTFIFCSDFITNCTIKKEKNEVKCINFGISTKIQFLWQITIYIGFCVKLDLDSNTLEIYDSIRKMPSAYERLQNFLQTIFSEIKRNQQTFMIKIIENFPQQQDWYSCGYFSCIALNYLCKSQINMGCDVQEKYISKGEMKQILKDLLIEDNCYNDIV